MRAAGTEAKAKRQTRAAEILAAVLCMSGMSAALQTTAAPAPPATKELAKTTVRWILVSIPDRKLALMENGKARKVYRVAVGKVSTPSPAGAFKIVNRITDPGYYHKGQVVAPGRGNPVGTRWMGLSAKSYGIHGTNQPDSIGKAASSGCIRMGKADLEELFELVEIGDPVQIRAERDEQIATVFSESAETEALAQVQNETGAGGGQ